MGSQAYVSTHESGTGGFGVELHTASASHVGDSPHAPRVGLQAGPAGDERARELRDQVAREAMAADAHHVFGLPLLGSVAEVGKFERQARGVTLEQVDIGVHSGGEACGDALRVLEARVQRAELDRDLVAALRPAHAGGRAAALGNDLDGALVGRQVLGGGC